MTKTVLMWVIVGYSTKIPTIEKMEAEAKIGLRMRFREYLEVI